MPAGIHGKQILEDAMIPWTKENPKGIEWSFQQEWAPVQGAKKTLECPGEGMGRNLDGNDRACPQEDERAHFGSNVRDFM